LHPSPARQRPVEGKGKNMARPKKNPAQAKLRNVVFRAADDDLPVFKQRAAQCGMNRSAYLRTWVCTAKSWSRYPKNLTRNPVRAPHRRQY
jgi:hypothetical protein